MFIRSLLAIGGVEIDCTKQIRFKLSDHKGIITEYLADGCMTWEEWIYSNYNPYLPDGKTKAFTLDDGAGNTGVFHISWDYEYKQPDCYYYLYVYDLHYVPLPGDKIIDGCLYNAD